MNPNSRDLFLQTMAIIISHPAEKLETCREVAMREQNEYSGCSSKFPESEQTKHSSSGKYCFNPGNSERKNTFGVDPNFCHLSWPT